MTREETLSRLRTLEPALRKKGVYALFLFGSMARGDAGPASDIDLFFDDDPADPMSYFSVIGIEQFLEKELRTPVDLIPRDSLHFMIRDDIVASAKQVY
jgi:predicted nucleotidyltransferase